MILTYIRTEHRCHPIKRINSSRGGYFTWSDNHSGGPIFGHDIQSAANTNTTSSYMYHLSWIGRGRTGTRKACRYCFQLMFPTGGAGNIPGDDLTFFGGLLLLLGIQRKGRHTNHNPTQAKRNEFFISSYLFLSIQLNFSFPKRERKKAIGTTPLYLYYIFLPFIFHSIILQFYFLKSVSFDHNVCFSRKLKYRLVKKSSSKNAALDKAAVRPPATAATAPSILPCLPCRSGPSR